MSALAVIQGALGDTVLLEPSLRALASASPPLTVWGPSADRLSILRAPRGPASEVAVTPRAALPLWGTSALPPALLELLRPFARVVAFTGPGPLADQVSALRGLVIAPARAADPDLAPASTHAASLPLSRLLAALSLPALGDARPRLAPTREDVARGRALARADDYVVVHPGSGGQGKRWPAAHLAAALAAAAPRLPRIVVVLGPAEADRPDPTLSALRDHLTIAGPPMSDLVALLAGARAVLGNDAGPTHLAVALGTPTLAVFGPTDPRAWSTATVTLRGRDGDLDDPSLVPRVAAALVDLAAR